MHLVPRVPGRAEQGQQQYEGDAASVQDTDAPSVRHDPAHVFEVPWMMVARPAAVESKGAEVEAGS